jgi:hypothetical protein
MNIKNKDKEGKELMVGITVSLSKAEAISFARSLPQWDKYYLVKISENPEARHIAKRERFVVARYPHTGENVDDGHAMFIDSRQPVLTAQKARDGE